MNYLPALENIELPCRSNNILTSIRCFLRESNVDINDDRAPRGEAIDFGIGELRLCVEATCSHDYTLSLVAGDILVELCSISHTSQTTKELHTVGHEFSKIILAMGVL
jgi:hypothetical protein